MTKLIDWLIRQILAATMAHGHMLKPNWPIYCMQRKSPSNWRYKNDHVNFTSIITFFNSFDERSKILLKNVLFSYIFFSWSPKNFKSSNELWPCIHQSPSMVSYLKGDETETQVGLGWSKDDRQCLCNNDKSWRSSEPNFQFFSRKRSIFCRQGMQM